MDKVKVTIYMDDQLKKEVQKHCIDLGISLSEYVVKATIEKMYKEKENS